jgi:predicted HTH transcriptional regulator
MNLPDDIQDLLDKPEGKQFEFKEDFPGGDAVAKTVIAFANQSGGFLIFGIRDEPREITGLEDTSVIQFEEQVTNPIHDRVAPAPSLKLLFVKPSNKRNEYLLKTYLTKKRSFNTSLVATRLRPERRQHLSERPSGRR